MPKPPTLNRFRSLVFSLIKPHGTWATLRTMLGFWATPPQQE